MVKVLDIYITPKKHRKTPKITMSMFQLQEAQLALVQGPSMIFIRIAATIQARVF